VAIVKHDSFDKAPLNDDALSRQQKLDGGSRFTSYKVYLLLCPWAQTLPGNTSGCRLVMQKRCRG